MATPTDITLHFPASVIINTSVQVGDTAYYLNSTNALGTHIHSEYNDIIEIGKVTAINRGDEGGGAILCEWAPLPAAAYFPPPGSYIMFSKDNKVNLSTLLGYYAEIEIVNNSKEEAELFSIASDVFVSSK